MATEIIKVPDISVFKAGKLQSLRDQKIYKNGVLQNFGTGSGIVKGNVLYVLDAETGPIVTMTTAKQSVSFIVIKTEDIEVDWGDGSPRQKNVFTHNYGDSVEHVITVYGSNAALTELWCFSNQLISLDVSRCAALTELWCYSNQLISLDVTRCAALTILECSLNQLISLDVSGCTALTELWCPSNQLPSLDVSMCTSLTRLGCYSNQLPSLDVSMCTALTELWCDSNPFVTNVPIITTIANSLPDRTGQDEGFLGIQNSNSQAAIQSICDAKNWSVG